MPPLTMGARIIPFRRRALEQLRAVVGGRARRRNPAFRVFLFLILAPCLPVLILKNEAALLFPSRPPIDGRTDPPGWAAFSPKHAAGV
jgi:hypothetical protein